MFFASTRSRLTIFKSFALAVLALASLMGVFHRPLFVHGAKFEYTNDPSKTHAILLIHGFYGANLNRRDTGERIWLTAANALFSKNTVARAEPGLEIAGAEELVPDGMLASVPLVPWIYTIDAYGSTLTWLENAFPEAAVIPFAYDWRADNLEAVRALATLVEKLKQDGKSRIDIVAHSMGGLIASYYLRYGTQAPETARETWEGATRIARVVFAVVPFAGTMHLFRNMHQGVRLGLNRSLLTGEAVSSFISSYEILPPLPNKVLDEKLQPIPQLLHDPDWWERENFGLLSFPIANEETRARRREFTRARVLRARAYLEKIRAPLANLTSEVRTKALTIVGTSRKTIDKVVWLQKSGVDGKSQLLFTDDDFKRAGLALRLPDLQDDGDESVTRESATLPTAFAKRLGNSEFPSTGVHSEILKDKDVRTRVLSFLKP